MKKNLQIEQSKRVLLADDDKENRDLLGGILSDRYEVIYAEDGDQTLSLLRDSGADYSLVLIDLFMPGVSGLEIIEICKEDDDLKRFPIIAMTSDRSLEVESIKRGAVDFIAKPYRSELILTRCDRIIELSEDRNIIRSTEYDTKSGLYNRSYFISYVKKLAPKIDMQMDYLALNIDRFNIINDVYGRDEGDRVLRTIGELIMPILKDTNSIACRVSGDIFYIWCVHRTDYEDIIRRLERELQKAMPTMPVHLHLGVYSHKDNSVEYERRFERARAAAERVGHRYHEKVGYYNHDLYERAVFNNRLIGDLDRAISERQITVYYQPKYAIQGEKPVLASAEALVRWNHPELGFISPGDFIPLFEKNGLIRKIDYFVWREAAAKIREVKDRFGKDLPISVNVSHVDIFDEELESKLTGLLSDFSISAHELILEITESAYSEDSEILISVVDRLRAHGFRVAMDDFGTGYSSLNMLTTIPIDSLKLDMNFIRNMHRDAVSMKLVEIVMDLSDIINVPVVAEGVEEESQYSALKEMGCSFVQGYYFSAPLPEEKFGVLLENELS